MSKRIKVTKNQLDELVDGDYKYLSDTDFKKYDGLASTSNSSNFSTDDYGEPVTTDEFVNMLNHQFGYEMAMQPSKVNKY